MNKYMSLAWLALALMATGAAAQTNVTNGNNGTSGTVPDYNGAASVTNSPISVSGSNVGTETSIHLASV